MRTRGVKVFDRVLQIRQVDWLVIPVMDCPDEAAERWVVCRHFRIPHGPWGSDHAFVRPVTVRRSRRRVLFRQESGVAL